MTAALAPPAAPVRPGIVPWRQLARVTLRQHRTALITVGAIAGLLAVALGVTGIQLHQLTAEGLRRFESSDTALRYSELFSFALELGPFLAGMFLGAPLISRETEQRTSRLAWTQDASRVRWLLAQVLPVTALLAVTAAALGAEFSWWLSQFPGGSYFAASPWAANEFNLTALLLPVWAIFGYSLGVFFGLGSRRTLPAVALTFVAYGAVLFVTAFWRLHYLAPLRRVVHVRFGQFGSWSGSISAPGPRGYQLEMGPAWPDGRFLPFTNLDHAASWFRAHHIVVQLTYQPASRYGLFQVIEFSWLIAASALLITVAAVVIRRRGA